MSYPLQPAHGGYLPQPQGYAVVSDQRTNVVEVTVAWILTVATLGYFLPWAIAATRGKRTGWVVGLVCLLTAWTVVGWIAALVMACLPHGTRTVAAATPQPGLGAAPVWPTQTWPTQQLPAAPQAALPAYGSGYNPYA